MAWNIQRWLGKCGCNITITISSCKILDVGDVEIELIIGESPVTLQIDSDSFLKLSEEGMSIIGDNVTESSVFTITSAENAPIEVQRNLTSIMKILNNSISGLRLEITEETEITEQEIIDSLISELQNKISNQTGVKTNNGNTTSSNDFESNIE